MTPVIAVMFAGVLVGAPAAAQTSALSGTQPPGSATPSAMQAAPPTTITSGAQRSAQPGAAAVVPDTLEQRMQACAMCHGKQGQGIRRNQYYPRLAGKPVEYLYNQLIGFRDKRRSSSPIMTYMVGALSDNYLHEIAAYYSALRPPFPPPAAQPTGARRALGEMLVLKGVPSRDIPACSSCHGGPLTGLLPAIPGLVGLFPDYISAQLGAWKNGVRNSSPPDCMARVASRLTGDDISAVAAYLSSRSVAPDIPAAPAQSVKLPLDCGSAR